MAGATQSSDEDLISDINVTPLVDIVLVLLIVLMVAANYIASQSLDVELPKAATGADTPETTLAISIDRDGQLHLDAEPISEAALETAVVRAMAHDRDARAVISADRATAHGDVVQVIDLLRRHQLTRFAIQVRPEDLKGPR